MLIFQGVKEPLAKNGWRHPSASRIHNLVTDIYIYIFIYIYIYICVCVLMLVFLVDVTETDFTYHLHCPQNGQFHITEVRRCVGVSTVSLCDC